MPEIPSSETESSVPEQEIPPAPGPVDKEKMEQAGEAKEKQKTQEDRESVLAETPEAGESETKTTASEKTRIEKNKEARAEEIKKQIEEELRKNPVQLNEEEKRGAVNDALRGYVSETLARLPEKGKKMYPDTTVVQQARGSMLDKMVGNKVISEKEKDNFCSSPAFYDLLKQGYDAGGLRLANLLEVMKEAVWGIPILQQIDFWKKYGGEKGEMMVMPRIDGRKTPISFEDLKDKIKRSEENFNLETEGAKRQIERKRLSEKEDTERQKRLIERLEGEEKQEQLAKERFEAAEKTPDEEKSKLLNNLAYEWGGANKRHRKIKALEKVLEAGKFKCTTEDGRKLEGEEAEKEMKRFKKELEDKNEKLSTEIIRVAEKLIGKKPGGLEKEAREKTGYKSKKETPDKQQAFRGWLTKEVQNIFKDQAKNLEISSGRKIRGVNWIRWRENLEPDLTIVSDSGKQEKFQNKKMAISPDAIEPRPVKKRGIRAGKKLSPIIRRRHKKNN